MSTSIFQINPTILRWARERAGLSVHEVSLRMKRDQATIDAWEEGLEHPTYVQLEKLAYNIYKRPLAIFFFPEPPEEEDFKESFRTLPDFEFEKLDSDTNFAIREAKSMQLSLIELCSGVNPAQKKIFKDIDTINITITELAKSVRAYIGISIDEQVRMKNSIEALKSWRNALQDNGIFIFKRSFKQSDVSGLCLHHDEFPLIYLNNGTSPNRQIFTIFHELAHILFGLDGITIRDDSYISSLDVNERNLEINSNKFASEFLLPSDEFKSKLGNQTISEELVKEFSRYFVVSKEVVLRKLLELNKVSAQYYKSMSIKWNKEFLEAKNKNKGGGNYYATKATYLGEKYLELAFSKYYKGSLSRNELADYLNMKPKNVMNIESFVLSPTTSE